MKLLLPRGSPNINLSNSETSATQWAADATFQGVCSEEVHGKRAYVEVVCTAQGVAATCGIGISHGGEATNVKIGSTVNSVGMFSDGSVITNNGSIGTGVVFSVNDWLGIALDRLAKTVQFRNVTLPSGWSTALSVAGLGDGIFYCLQLGTNKLNDSWTVNFHRPLLGSPPDLTYRRWDGAPLSSPWT